MPADLWTDAARMAECGLLIAAVAVPVGLAARFIAQRNRQPILLRPGRWPVPWSGLELLILFPFAAGGAAALVDPLLAATGYYRAVYGSDALEQTWAPMRPLWSAAFFSPLFVGLLWLLARLVYPTWRPAPTEPVARTTAGIGTWLILHPVVAGIHFAVAAVFLSQGWPPDSHPLEKSFRDGRPAVDDVLLLVQAAIATPVLEEVLFRGALLPWLLGRRYRPAVMMLIAIALAVVLSIHEVDGGTALRIGPVIFAAILLATGALIHFRMKRHRRTAGAIYASAAFFAVVHSSVWPTPIPLFALGLGLGWLAIRTRGIFAPIIVHGLFNAVSVLFVLG